MKSPSIKVLLIDEHREDRMALRECLLKANDKVRVYEAVGGEAALDWFRAVQPDCIVLELKQRDIVGMEVLDRIVLEISKKPVPIFIWTRLSLPIVSATTSSMGIRGYFEKHKDSEDTLVTAILDATTDV